MARRWHGSVRRIGWSLVAAGVLCAGVWVVVRASGSADADDFQRWTNWSNILALLTGAIGTTLVVLDRLPKAAVAAVPPGGEVVRDLSARLESDWADEAALRDVTRPAPITVRWSSTGRPAADRASVLDSAGDWRTFPLHGEVGLHSHIVDALRDLPHRQLVVLGAPGSGKSVFAVLLTLGLLRRPAPGEPLPVLLPINVWEPAKEDVGQFVRRRLAEDYADVLGRHGDPDLLARDLTDRKLIMPVLDGLDELPAGSLARAATALDEYAGAGRPLVVTCRPSEYEVAVRRRVLSRAAVVELEPVEVEAAIRYLSEPRLDARWSPVFEAMRLERGGSLARAFSTPLMVSLARAAYEDPASDPGELCAMPHPSAITDRLMDAYVAGAFTRTRWPRASRWLAWLAGHLDHSGSRDLNWWRITPATVLAAPVRRAAAGLLTVAGLLAAPAGPLAVRVGGIATLTLLVGSTGWFRPLWPLGTPRYTPLEFRTARQRRTRSVGLRLAYGGGGAVVAGLLGLPWLSALAGGIAASLCTAVLPADRLATRPGRYVGAVAGLFGAACGSAFALGAALGSRLGVAVVFGATTALWYAAVAALGAGAAAWVGFRLTHLWLVLRGRLPFRLRQFLNDAHRSGVLRRNGSVHQFRHVLLQERLARQLRGSSADPLGRALARLGPLDELRAWADGGQEQAAIGLAALLGRRGHLGELIVRADLGDRAAAKELAIRLVESGRLGDLRLRAGKGDEFAMRQLTEVLVSEGRLDEAITLLRPAARRGLWFSAEQLTVLLLGHGRIDDAIALLTLHADTGNWAAASRLAEVLAAEGRIDELRRRARAGDTHATERLTEMLETDEAIEFLTSRAAPVGWALDDFLASRGRDGDLRSRAAGGDWYAAILLAERLAEDHRTSEAVGVLLSWGGMDASRATDRLARHLTAKGRFEEAITLVGPLCDAGDEDAVARTVDCLLAQDRVGEAVGVLGRLADAGSLLASENLAALLEEQHLVDQLRSRADARDAFAPHHLARLLAADGEEDELRKRAQAGDWSAARSLAGLLASQDRPDEAIELLRPRAEAGDLFAGDRLADLLAENGRRDDAIALLRPRADEGDDACALRMARIMADGGRAEDAVAVLRTLVLRDSDEAAAMLASLLAERAEVEL